MKSTTLTELLRDISERLGVLIKTSALPNRTERISSTPSVNLQHNSQNQEERRSSNLNQSTSTSATTTTTTTNSSIDSQASSSTMSTTSTTNLVLNSHERNEQTCNSYTATPRTTSTTTTTNYCGSNRGSIGSVHELDEVRSVIVTGCGSKIGRKIATAFARLDFNISLVDFATKQTETVAEECQEASPKNRVPLQIIADISQLDQAHKVIDRAVKQFGRLDVLVNTINNAALMEAHFTGGQSDDDPHVFEQYHRIIANNMHSVTYLCISAAPHLRRSKGSIVNVSSISENDHGSYKFAYSMSKAGIWTLTKCLATDYAPDINVICVSDQPTPPTPTSSTPAPVTTTTTKANTMEDTKPPNTTTEVTPRPTPTSTQTTTLTKAQSTRVDQLSKKIPRRQSEPVHLTKNSLVYEDDE